MVFCFPNIVPLPPLNVESRATILLQYKLKLDVDEFVISELIISRLEEFASQYNPGILKVESFITVFTRLVPSWVIKLLYLSTDISVSVKVISMSFLLLLSISIPNIL